MKTSKISVLLLVVALVSLPISAFGLNMGVGRPDGGYEKFMTGVSSDFGGIEITNTKGSVDILERVIAGELDGGIIQNDVALSDNFIDAPIMPIGLAYYETIVIVAKDKKYTKWSQLKKSTVAIGPIGSGTEATFETLKRNNPKFYKNMMVQNHDGQAAAGLMDAGRIQAIMVVTSMNSGSLKTFVEKGYHFVTMDDSKVKKVKWNDSPVYMKQSIKKSDWPDLKTLFKGGKYNTVLVPAIVVVSYDYGLDEDNNADLNNLGKVVTSVSGRWLGRLKQTDIE